MSTSKKPKKHPAQSAARPNVKSRSKKIRWIGLAIGLAGVAFLSATAGALLAVSLSSTPLLQSQLSPEDEAVFTEEEKISTGSTFRLPQLTRPVNVLVLGIKVISSDLDDPPPGSEELGYHALVNSFEGLSDTMLLLRFNPRDKQLTVLSIPRDTRAAVDGVGVTKVNSANIYGGPALTARTLSDVLGGVTVDRYVRINVQGVEKLIDALGGVKVNVPKDMYYKDDSQHLYINLKQGTQQLNGDQAMQFLRFRYDDYGDIGRVQRQQMLMRSLVEQSLNPKTIARLPKILSVIQSHVDTNLSVEELVALVGFAAQVNRSDVQMLMLPGEFSAPDEFDLSYWIPDYHRIDDLVDQYFAYGARMRHSAEDPAYLRVAIQDSIGNDAAVDRLIERLEAGGYTNIYLDEPLNDPLGISRVIAQQGDSESAEMLHRYLGLGEMRVESTGALRSDVTIQLGQDWVDQELGSTPAYPTSGDRLPNLGGN